MLLGSGLEVIAFQRTRPIFKLLTAEVQAIMDKMAATNQTQLTDALLNDSKLAQIMQEASGFEKITMIADAAAPINAYTQAITLSKNHVFNDSIRQAYSGHADAYNLYRRVSGVLTGQIDLETGRVSGAFSKIPITIALGNQMLNPKHGITAEENTAILLHELGHDFTYCYALHYSCTTNMVLHAAANALLAAGEVKQKHAIMSDVENTLGIKIDNQAELVNYDKYDGYYITLLTKYSAKIYDAVGATAYNTNMCEQLADMFAARHGAGAAMVSGINRINLLYAPYRPNKYVAMTKSLLAHILFFPIMIPMFLTALCSNDWVSATYDVDKDRFIRLRNESIASLKDPRLTAVEKKQIVAEIEQMNKIIAATDYEWSVSQKLGQMVRSSQRSQIRQKRLLQDLEALTNNPLYVAAAKYSV